MSSTRHLLEIVKGVERHPNLPVSRELTWTIRHPDKEANIPHVKYSPDGKRLFLTGYPSGVTQFWDLENRKEIRRFESAKGLRGSSDYAQLTPDWKTLVISEETRKSTRIEKDGKKDLLLERSGTVQIWDVETGEQKSFLYPESDHGPGSFQLSPDGKKLVLVEMRSLRRSELGKISHAQTSLWDLQTQARYVLGDSFLTPTFSSDSKFGFISVSNLEKKTSMVKKIDLDNGKTLAEIDCSELVQTIRLEGISPDNRWIVAQLGTRIDSPPIILFLDAATLKEKGRLVLEAAAPKISGWHISSFSPDGKFFETADWKGNIHLWSLEERKVIRIIPLENGSWVRQFSPDGRFLAIVGMPKYDASFDDALNPDPLDMPQPRISLIDLKDPAKPPIVLIAPHGYCGSLAFRPDGKQLAFGSSGGVHIFDIEKLVTKKEKP